MRYREIGWAGLKTGLDVNLQYGPPWQGAGVGGVVDFVGPECVWITSGTAEVKRCVMRRDIESVNVEEYLDADECLDWRDDGSCRGPVDYRWTGSSRHWPRCEAHWDLRMAKREKSMEVYADSDVEPDWFDPTDIGERWDDDY